MEKLFIIKNYFRAALIMGFFAVLVMYLPDNTVSNRSDIYLGMPVSDASVQYEIFNDPDFELQQLHGVRIMNPDTGKFTYYFEYMANKQDTLRRISALPFLKDNRPSSLACELMNTPVNPMDNNLFLSQEEKDATSFFWSVRAEDFTFYECYKSPVKHTLLLSKTSDRILHKVEFI